MKLSSPSYSVVIKDITLFVWVPLDSKTVRGMWNHKSIKYGASWFEPSLILHLGYKVVKYLYTESSKIEGYNLIDCM